MRRIQVNNQMTSSKVHHAFKYELEQSNTYYQVGENGIRATRDLLVWGIRGMVFNVNLQDGRT